MTQRANPAVVGGFVVGALVLLVAGVLMFGSGALLRERVSVVAFFTGNVRGLQEGSAVEFRGVQVAAVYPGDLPNLAAGDIFEVEGTFYVAGK